MNHPFDTLAPTYDRDFTESPIGAWLRARTHRWLAGRLQGGGRVLELGCGTGEDALFLSRSGMQVLATDASAGMLARASEKLAGDGAIALASLDLNRLSAAHDFDGPFDLVLANFGVLNVVHDRRQLAGWLAARVRPGGGVCLGVMGPLCAWESAWHLLHGDTATATRRWRGETRFETVAGTAMPVFYPAPHRVRREFSPYFRGVALRGLGVWLPPSDIFGAVTARPRLLRVLTALETVLAANPLAAYVGDHYWLELERVP
ncbi:MAG: class I SAM-dependent methyltransferase [Anaerolineae bacterium]